ncbi:hypothetical protein SAMN05421810_105232 [Amycolatopsis arida]|uniref:Uncharacterized protein n=1 Tax=Amycolatopsis arida TaxID=587909 RepID=A0A1I5WQW4_9PSEU|nr:hypothetical protein [Amycolatopsis arida]TDX92406.1 hypothetical protein CLV69_105251 [Amycolatopsis arida]SFQ22195.1 hypothetical protein SAMN05421810_105232 [Amycolatopsis arida]
MSRVASVPVAPGADRRRAVNWEVAMSRIPDRTVPLRLLPEVTDVPIVPTGSTPATPVKRPPRD